MGTKIAVFLIVIAACIGGYFIWAHYSTQKQSTNGDVSCTGCMTPDEKARFDKENSGDTADGNSEHKDRTARAEDAAGNPEGAVAAGQVAPTAVKPGSSSKSNPAATTIAPAAASGTYSATSASAPPPATDSQGANNPNNMRFGGSGSYQWYRQGNLTYRVDTVSGTSCIAYATMDEWRKQIVYSHGCGKGA